jgi:aminomethyltransferase
MFSDEILRKTPLHSLHVAKGAFMTGFGGWDMPLYYEDGILKEHLHCRAAAGLFDVSHMLGVKITGPDRVAFAEKVMPAGIQELPEGQGCLTSLPNENGGLIDDCIVTNAGDHLFLVINAGHEDKDVPHMRSVLDASGLNADFALQEGKGILALQGPKAVNVLSRLTENVDFSQFGFMTGRNLVVNGEECFVTRSGYTGEDGFEISCEGDVAEGLAKAILAEPEAKPIGLGARDSLRLEAGLCLYGNDIDDNTTPVSAGLLWTIGKRRRKEGGFVGADKILAEVNDRSLVTDKRVGLVLTGKGPPPRSHDVLYNEEGEKIGEVTSGVFGPTAKKAVAMGWVKKEYSKKGTQFQVQIRKKKFGMEVASMPFVPANFFKG